LRSNFCIINENVYCFRDLDHRSKVDDQDECCNCEIMSQSPMHPTPKGILCDECFVYWQKSGLMRPELYRTKPAIKKIKRPPKNLSLDINNFTPNSIEQLEENIQNELTRIQSSNQILEQLTIDARRDLENLHIPFLISSAHHSNETATTTTWSTEEILLALQAFAKYGKDYSTIARIIGGTKTRQDIEKFYIDYRERYQLDMIIDNYYSKSHEIAASVN